MQRLSRYEIIPLIPTTEEPLMANRTEEPNRLVSTEVEPVGPGAPREIEKPLESTTYDSSPQRAGGRYGWDIDSIRGLKAPRSDKRASAASRPLPRRRQMHHCQSPKSRW